jgi:hypothetical protein
VINFVFILAKVIFTAVILPNIFHDLTRLFLDFCCKSFWFLVQNHVSRQSTTQGLLEDCGR